MAEKIYEIRIVKVDNMPPQTRREIIRQVNTKSEHFDYQGYAKITYITASPKSIKSIEPIEGTAIDYFKGKSSQISVF